MVTIKRGGGNLLKCVLCVESGNEATEIQAYYPAKEK